MSLLQLLLLPQPPFKPIYYTLVIMDLCKVGWELLHWLIPFFFLPFFFLYLLNESCLSCFPFLLGCVKQLLWVFKEVSDDEVWFLGTSWGLPCSCCWCCSCSFWENCWFGYGVPDTVHSLVFTPPVSPKSTKQTTHHI